LAHRTNLCVEWWCVEEVLEVRIIKNLFSIVFDYFCSQMRIYGGL
jgi:hypothetical protein